MSNITKIMTFTSTVEQLIRTKAPGFTDRLPGQRELATRFNLSQSLVHIGMTELKNRGIIVIEPYKGASVAAQQPETKPVNTADLAIAVCEDNPRQRSFWLQAVQRFERIAPEIRFYAAVRLLLFHSSRKNSSDILDAEEFEADAFAFFKRSIEHLTCIVKDAEIIRKDQLVRFRYLIWCFLRDDSRATLAKHFPMAFAALRFLIGKGTLKPTLLNLSVTAQDLFHFVCRCHRKADALEPFFRFLRGRLTSMHFCGSPALGLTFEYGMAYLLLMFPIVIFLASVFAAQRKDFLISAEDVTQALILADHGFLRSKLFTRRSTKSAAWNLMKGEDYAFLMKLCLRQKILF